MSNLECPTPEQLVDERISRVLTQYRESPKLLHVLKTYMNAVSSTHLQICDLPSFFNIDSATGDQLTILGKHLGWLRTHCVCEVQPVFGFDCDDGYDVQPVSGFCDSGVTWINCGVEGTGEIHISDDEIYRMFLKVRLYQKEARFDIESLETCLKIFWGDDASVISAGFGRVVVTPGRALEDTEIALLQLYARVLPVALGVEVRFHFDRKDVFGFGEGWGGFCEPYKDADEIDDGNNSYIVDEDSNAITTGALTKDAPWLCEINVNPYGC